ncbi:recombinase family protein [uncultured Mucilaginibacter sp.]|uniref:recombinase family protein n=1 Tax=uncultured Mucilaginibacter sp. TaxID=797541 RepID=UPI0025F6C261|nr:recombinase family protein [uncultured Mucilaginibacter sp.]
MDVVILTRVSKESQSYDRQIKDLRTYAERMNYTVAGEFNEKISGATKNEDRLALTQLSKFTDNNKVDKILVWELSRLGRNTLEVLKSLDLFHTKGISLYVLNYNIETLNEDGTINPMAQMMCTMLAEFSRAERAAILQRLTSGYKKHLAGGGHVGRIKGVVMDSSILIEKHKETVKYLKKGRSIRETAKLVQQSTRTVLKVKKAMAA